MENGLKQDLSCAGMTLLVLLLLQNLLILPFLVVRRGMFYINGYGFSPFVDQLGQTLVYCGTMLGTLFFGVWLFRCSREFLFPLSVPRSDYLYPALGTGLGVGMLVSAMVTLLTAFLGLVGVHPSNNIPTFGGGVAATLLTMLSVSVLPAILEELLFRGLLLQPLRRYGDRVAIVLSATMFALCHTTLPQALSAFAMGLCLGVFAVRSGSLVVPMLIHLLYNTTACAVTLLSLYLPVVPASIISWLLIFSLLAVGIYGSKLLKSRFGSVWWVSPSAWVPIGHGRVAFAAFCTIPLMLAFIMSFISILRNL